MTSYKLPCIITRGNNVYGPHQFPEKLVPKFTLLARRGEPLPVHGGGQVSAGVSLCLPTSMSTHCAVPCNSQVKLAAILMLPDSLGWRARHGTCSCSRHGLCHPGCTMPRATPDKLTAMGKRCRQQPALRRHLSLVDASAAAEHEVVPVRGGCGRGL